MSDQESSKPSELSKLDFKDAFELYENGKQRRYGLLFAINGGAFAIASLLVQEGGDTHSLGRLTIRKIAFLLIVLNLFLASDLFLFGQRFHKVFRRDLFRLWGKVVLLVITISLILGWVMASRGTSPVPVSGQ